MDFSRFWAYPILLLFLISGCKSNKLDQAYVAEVESWRAKRLASLTSPTGWTTLIGLYWLEEGENTIGSDESMDISFGENIPGKFATATLSGGEVYFKAEDGIDVKPFNEGRARPDTEDSTDIFSYGSYNWFFIQRGDRYGLRLKDTLAKSRFALKSLPHFPVSGNFLFDAEVLPHETGETVGILNQVGQVSDFNIEGIVHFQYNGKEYKLLAFDGGPSLLWILFSDETTGISTYGGGRYLYIKRPDEKGMTRLDFNRAYNPPCVYSDFATCPLPPRENDLSFAVRAGEKYVDKH